ncbi:MAG: hypothetical protein V1794_10645 [Candidatus Glassbacteria bacterium]
MHPEPLDKKISRRNLILALCLAGLVALLALSTIVTISPEAASGTESILSGMR